MNAFWRLRRLVVVGALGVVQLVPAGAANAAPPESRSATTHAPKLGDPSTRVRFVATDEQRRAAIAELTRARRATLPTTIDDADRQRLARATAAFRATNDLEARALLREAARNMRARGAPPAQIRAAIGAAIYAGLIATAEAEQYADRIRFYTDALTILSANKATLVSRLPAEGAVGAAQLHRVSQRWSPGASPDLGTESFGGNRAQFKERLEANENDIRAVLHVIQAAAATEATSDAADRAAREAAIMRALGAAAEAYADLRTSIDHLDP